MDTNRKMASVAGNFYKRTRDLESMMSDVQLINIDNTKPKHSWQRSSSLKSTLSERNKGISTPRGTSPAGKHNKKLAPKKRVKKTKVFFGSSSY